MWCKECSTKKNAGLSTIVCENRDFQWIWWRNLCPKCWKCRKEMAEGLRKWIGRERNRSEFRERREAQKREKSQSGGWLQLMVFFEVDMGYINQTLRMSHQGKWELMSSATMVGQFLWYFIKETAGFNVLNPCLQVGKIQVSKNKLSLGQYRIQTIGITCKILLWVQKLCFGSQWILSHSQDSNTQATKGC